MSTSRHPRFEKRIEPRVVTYRLTRYLNAVPFGIELCVVREEYELGRAVVARRLLRARTKLRQMAAAVATNREFA
jgi:hypothetical protein